MKKITDFIIDKRHIILVLFIIFTIFSAFLSKNVKINYDIAKYLPPTSDTRIGMDIMEKEFSSVETSNLNVMFEDLTSEEKLSIKQELTSISGVKQVNYDETENYNKNKYTLYVIEVEGKSDSTIASNVYDTIKEKYKNKTLYTSGAISETNKNVLPIWIIALAVFCALIILLIMCESFVEPFLFLITILMAVVLNKGTNIIFNNVSHITNSIVAILQMALSMDYSIMLMNRYDQEKKQEKDKVKAMKNALHKAFLSISSSSITTIVGLLALVFMSFKIGKDLGIILAKGVLFSLICIFFVLPSLILMFDKWIIKTKKKSLHLKLDKIGKISYKFRFISLPIFIIVFLCSFMLKGNLAIDYTDRQSDKISQVFKENNEIVILYKNDEEEKIAEYQHQLENKHKIEEVLGYSNTINEKITYDNLNNKLTDLKANISIEDYLLKIIYYDFYNRENKNQITLNDFLSFIEQEAYNNAKINEKIDNNTKKDITRLENFATEKMINKKRTSSELANILGFDKSKIEDILIYYYSNNKQQLSLKEFIDFINNEVLTNEKYSSKIDNNSKAKLNILTKFVNEKEIQKEMTVTEMTNFLEIDKNIIDELYKYYILSNDIDLEITISEFSNFVFDNILNDNNYKNDFEEEIKLLKTFSNINIINKQMNSKELSNLFSIDKEKIDMLLLLKNIKEKNTNNYTITPKEFIEFILNNTDDENIKNNIDDTAIKKLKLLQTIMTSSINNETFTYQEISYIINMDINTTKQIYTLYLTNKNEITLSPKEFIDFILNHQNDTMLINSISTDTIKNLNLINLIMTSTLNNKKYDSNSLSSLLGIDKENLDLIYGLYTFINLKENETVTLKEFIEFILDNVITNPEYASNFDNEKITKLNTVNTIIENSLNNKKYTSDEMFEITSKLSNDIKNDTIKILYIYYGSSRQYEQTWQMTIEQFVNYLDDNIITNSCFADFIEDDMKENIKEAKAKIKDAKKLLVSENYSRIVLNTKLDLEGIETFNTIENIKNTLEKELDEFYVIGDSPMANEMSKTFDSELNLITIITMILIFIVVTITFKSIIIPLILVLTIQCAVYLTMGILSITGENVYFIALLIVQSILMGATIDYAILYTSYYLEHRKKLGIKQAIIESYHKSINTILTSSSILIIVTLIIANFASAIAAKICKTISEGTICSTILILVLLPSILAFFDKIIIKNRK